MKKATKTEITSKERRRRIDAFKSILIPHPRLETLQRRIEHLIDDTKAIVAKNEQLIKKYGRAAELDHLRILPVVGPSGATKSRSMGEVLKHVLDNMTIGDNDVPILFVTLRDTIKHTKHLQAQILAAYGDKSAGAILTARNYLETAVNDDIREAALSRNTSLIICDETHNVLGGTAKSNDAAATTTNMARAFKSMLNDGLFSIVCLGTEEMQPLLRNPELAGRMREPVDFGRMELSDQEDREYFFNFVGMFEDEMVEKRVIDEPIGLLDTVERRACVYDLADGVIGTVVRILETSLETALENGRSTLTLKDIGASIRARNKAISQSTRDKDGSETLYYDPFTKGPKRRTLAILTEEEEDQKKMDEEADG